MSADWIQVYSSDKSYEVEMVMAFLTDNEIKCIRMNKRDMAYLIGEIEVYVSADDAFNAHQLIIQFKGE
jgi:hypothetical protein